MPSPNLRFPGHSGGLGMEEDRIPMRAHALSPAQRRRAFLWPSIVPFLASDTLVQRAANAGSVLGN